MNPFVRKLLENLGLCVKPRPMSLARYLAQDYDLIQMDLVMPGKDGIEAMKQFRELQAARERQPIISP